MRKSTKELRAAYIQKLSTLEYNGINIPVFDTEAIDYASIPIGGGTAKAYVVLKDQTRGNNSVKNRHNFPSRISMEVITKFGGNSFGSGGNELVETITENAYDLLFDGLRFDIREFYGYRITDTKYHEVNVPMMYNETDKIYRVMVIFTHQVEII